MKKSLQALALLLALGFGMGTPLVAHSNIEEDGQIWPTVIILAPTTQKWRPFIQSTAMFGDQANRLDREVVHIGLGRQITPHLSIWGGGTAHWQFHPVSTQEYRIFEQLMWEKRTQKRHISLMSRFRVEDRFFEGAGGPVFRTRWLNRTMIPVDKKERWFVIASNEFFYNLNSENPVADAGYEGNRTFIGLGRKLNAHARLETGYMLMAQNRPNSPNNRLNHVWTMTLFVRP